MSGEYVYRARFLCSTKRQKSRQNALAARRIRKKRRIAGDGNGEHE